MARSPCCDKNGLKKGPWTPEEDQKLIDYIQKHGCGNWRTLPKNAGLQRCGKSCRLRWTNYLRPDIKRGGFSFEEEETIIQLHGVLGNKWSAIAARLPGRTDNEIKNYWNTHIRKRLLRMGIDPVTHSPRLDLLNLSSIFNSSLYNQSHTNLSRLLGVVDPQLLKLATSLISDQNQTQIPQFEAAYSTNLNTTCEVPFSDQAQLMSTSFDHFGTSTTSEWPNIGNIDYVPSLPSYYNNFCYGSDQADPSFSEPSNLYSANSNRKNNTSFSFNVNTPSCSPPPLTSSSTYTNNGAAGSCSTVTDQDERGSYCSSLLKFEVPDLLDVSELL